MEIGVALIKGSKTVREGVMLSVVEACGQRPLPVVGVPTDNFA